MKKSSLKININTLFLGMAFVLFTMISSTSYATTLSFENITNNSSVQLSDQLSVEISEVVAGVEFKFLNNVGIGSSITDVYFDLGTNSGLFSAFSIAAESLGVSFDLAPHPQNLPGGNTVDFTADFGGDSTTPTSANGVNAAGEYITFLGTLGSGFNYDNFLADLMSGSFRIGMHLQSIEGGGKDDSDSYVSAIPIPAAAWLFGTALFGFVAASRRKKNLT